MNLLSTSQRLFATTPRPKPRALRALLLGAALLVGGVALLPMSPRAAWAQATGSTSSVIPAWARGQIIGSVPLRPGDKAIAITFDDGPQPGSANTEGVLSALSSLNVRGTFFMIGSAVQTYPALARRVRDAGHAIGNHTWSHSASPIDPVGEVASTDAIIQSTLGQSTALFRPPYGNMTNGYSRAAQAQGDAVVLWSIDPHDYNTPAAQTMADHVIAAATPGAILLLHDAGGDRSQTVAMLPIVVNALRLQGYRFVTVPELFDLRDAGLATPPSSNPTSTVGDGLNATYYSRTDFSGTAVSRVDPRVSFDWGKKTSPASGIGKDSYSARWTGQVVAPTSGSYTFIMSADDGMRLWVDGNLVLDRWRLSAGESSATVSMTAGRRTEIRVEYYESTGSADIALSWSGPGVPRQIIPQSALFSRASSSSLAPSIALASPSPEWSYRSLGAASGTVANNGGGVPTVGAMLFRYSDSTYWNGSAWVAAPEGSERAASVSGTPTTTGGSTYNWSYALPPLSDGRYAIQAIARDRAGGSASLAWTLFYVDTTPPRVLVDMAPGVYPEVARVYGSAYDVGPGVSGIGVGLKRLSDGAFWNGSAWIGSWFELPVQTYPIISVDSSLGTGWTTPLPALAPGDYSLKAVAHDYVGNEGQSGEVRFTINLSAPAQLIGSAPTSSRPASILSSGQASAPSTIQARFRVPLHSRSLALPHFQVLVNGQPVAPESLSYDRATNTLTLSLPNSMRRGDRVSLAWKFLLAPNGRKLPDGLWLGTAG